MRAAVGGAVRDRGGLERQTGNDHHVVVESVVRVESQQMALVRPLRLGQVPTSDDWPGKVVLWAYRTISEAVGSPTACRLHGCRSRDMALFGAEDGGKVVLEWLSPSCGRSKTQGILCLLKNVMLRDDTEDLLPMGAPITVGASPFTSAMHRDKGCDACLAKPFG